MAMRIDLEVGSLGTATSGLHALAGELDQVAAALTKAGSAGASAGGAIAAGSRAAGASAASSFSGPGDEIARQLSRISGPGAKAQRAAGLVDLADRFGNATQQEDARIQQFRAQRSLELGRRRLEQGDDALKGPGLLDLFQELNGLMSSLRGGNLLGGARSLMRGIDLVSSSAPGGLNIAQKLAGSIGGPGTGAAAAAEAGSGGALASLGTALAGTVGIVTGFGAALLAAAAAGQQAAAALRSISAVTSTTGGSTAEVSRFGAMGMDRGSIAGTAGGLRGRLASDPLAMQASAQLGFGPAGPAHLGDQNQARGLMEHLDALRKVTDAEERLRLARMLGLEASLDLINVSDDVWRHQKGAANLQAAVADPRSTQAARDLNGEWARLGTNMESLAIIAGKPFLSPLTQGLEFLNGSAEKLAVPLNQIASVFELINEHSSPLLDLLKALSGENPYGGKSETQENTEAVKENSRALKEGGSGGGPGTRRFNAVPEGLAGKMMQQAIEGQRFSMGAFR